MKIESDSTREIRFKFFFIDLMGEGGQIFVKSYAGLVSVYKNTYRSEIFEC